jgi:cytochrome c551/c552
MAYLQAAPARDPPPDPLKGQVVLVRKGCLKCHSLRGEGGQIGPDLAARRADYASAAAWAATMWTHTPRMAAVAAERGVLYPRFSRDEMGNLLGFLRSASAASPQ